ncbi:MAG TPA: lysylphosphatidylglycerol synthase domain-containing protein, partial [Acidimicrobiia bacterium]
MRVVIAATFILLAARHAGDVTASERALLDLFNSLPGGLVPLGRALYRLGALWAVSLVVVAALVGRRWRLARDLLLSGFAAWLIARALGEVVVAHESIRHSVRVATALSDTPSFPAVRVAVTVAVISAAGPYVTLPTRIIGRGLVVLLAMTTLYLGTAFPNDLFAGLVLGWGVAAVVHLAFGSPGGRPTAAQVAASLAELGIPVRAVSLASRQPNGSTLMYATAGEDTVRVKVIGRDEADAQFLTKLWRSALYRDAGPPLSLTRLQQVEREAYLMLVARQAGVGTPSVVVAGKAGPGAALLVQEQVVGRKLSALDASEVDDHLLARVWEQVGVMHCARVAHGQLDADHIVVGADAVWIVGFDAATSTGNARRIATDTAELLASTAGMVGEERAVRAVAAALGPAHLVAALPYLQPAALTRTTRRLTGDRRREVVDRLERLRDMGAAAAGVDPPELVQLRRVDFTSLAMAIGALVAVGALLSDVGDPAQVWATLRNADWVWLAVAMVPSFVSNVAYAWALQGTVPVRLPLWPTTELQLGMSFTNLAVPGIGGTGMQVRFLQKLGVDLSSAVAAGGILSVMGNLIAAVGLFGIALAVDPAHIDLSLLPTNGLLALTIGVVAAVGAASAVVLAIPKLRASAIPPIRRAVGTMWEAIRSPRQVVLLIGGNVLATLLSTWCLQACLVAF